MKNKIERFITDYKNLSRTLFVDNDGSLYHNGEFGMYREEIVRTFVKNFFHSKYDVSEGFLITPKDNHSTQCDVVVFNKENTPFITDNKQRFFPIESVISLIEVKSVLSKSDFKTALIKLSNIKKLREDISNTPSLRNGESFNTNNELNHFFTILICEKLDFIINDLDMLFNEIYIGIDRKYWHNIILSLDDGVITYSSGKALFPFPTMKGTETKISTKGKNENFEHLFCFSVLLQLFTKYIDSYEFDMTHYLFDSKNISNII